MSRPQPGADQGTRDQGDTCGIEQDVLMPSNPASLIIVMLCWIERSIPSGYAVPSPRVTAV